MASLQENTFFRDPNFVKSLNDLSEGMQVLREYIFFNNFNFLKQCQIYDKLDTGKLAIPKFETALKKSPYRFSDKHIQEIIQDSPKSRKSEIMYRQLHFLLSKGEKPTTKITAKMMAPSHSINLGGDSPHRKDGETFEEMLSRYFSLKTIHQFENFDLQDLDLKLLQEKNKPHGTSDELAVRNIYASNNLALIENFQISVANKIYNVLANQEKLVTATEQIPLGLMHFLKKTPHDMQSPLSELDLQSLIHRFEINLTLDETNFLYFLIFASFAENVLNLKCFANWIQAYHYKRLKHVFKTADLFAEMPTKLYRRIEIPLLYQDLIKIIQEIGFEKIQNALNLLETRNGISFEHFQRFLKQYSIDFTPAQFNEFKLWLAQEGILDISNRENLGESITYIVLNRLLNALRKTCQELYIPVTAPTAENLTLESAITIFNRKVLQTYWKNIEENLLVVSDGFRMINELKIRDILKNMVHGLDNTIINRIFGSFKYSEEISKGSLQKRIFVDEFIATVRDAKFDPLPVPKRPEQPLPSVEPFMFESLDQGSSPYKSSTNQGEPDPKELLGKLERILTSLMNSPALLYVRPEEKNIPTLPLLKILESYDKERTGSLQKNVFRQVLIESFPVFNQFEIEALVNMADKMSSTHEKENVDNFSGSPKDKQTKYIPYYYFLLQIEKYFELNKLCQQPKANG